VAATKGRALGRIVLHWDGQRVLDAEPRLLETYADSLPVAPDAGVVALLDSISDRVRPFVSRVLARTPRRLGPEVLANLVTDAMCRASGAEIAVANIGSVRTDLQPGEITEGELFEVVPFENTLVTSHLTGMQLDAFLESSPNGARVSGMRVRLGPRDATDRVQLEDTKGRPLDPARTYLVVTNNFIAYGGDGFRGFLDGNDVTWTPLLVRQAVQDWMIQKSRDGVLEPDTTLRVLPAAGFAASRP
jgi:2',3'-cyclic-nucleotide 2'-phosphodiesterase (5'-nucleotidase family)